MGRLSDKMAGISECRTLCGRDEMVGEEIVFLFTGGDYRIFGGTAVSCRGSRRYVLRVSVFHDHCDCCKDSGLGRSGIRLAVVGMHYFSGKRNSAFLYRNCRAVFVKDLPGNKAQTDFHSEGFQ